MNIFWQVLLNQSIFGAFDTKDGQESTNQDIGLGYSDA
jgi:hypothetical protein